MTTVQATFAICLWLSLATGIFAALGAHLAADHSKRNGVVPKRTSDFFRLSKSMFSIGIGPSLQDIFSNVHRRYESRFITRCIYAARVVFALAGAFAVALLITAFLS
jgi:hypothetical protein